MSTLSLETVPLGAPSGTPLVFLHGWGSRPEAYEESLRTWESQGYRVWAPALPGHSGEPALPRGEHSLLGLSEWVVTRGQIPGDMPVVFAGHSLGAAVAVLACARWCAATGLPSSLLLLSPAGAGTGFGPREWITALSDRRPQGSFSWGAARATWARPLRTPWRTARLGWESRTLDLLPTLESLVASGVPVTVVHALSDRVVDSAPVLEVSGVRSVVIDEHHSWPEWRPDLAGVAGAWHGQYSSVSCRGGAHRR